MKSVPWPWQHRRKRNLEKNLRNCRYFEFWMFEPFDGKMIWSFELFDFEIWIFESLNVWSLKFVLFLHWLEFGETRGRHFGETRGRHYRAFINAQLLSNIKVALHSSMIDILNMNSYFDNYVSALISMVMINSKKYLCKIGIQILKEIEDVAVLWFSLC